MERNGDIVAMSSYAPLLAKEGNTQWNPGMIYFTNTEVRPTVGYFAHKLCGQHTGDEYIQSTLQTNEQRKGVRERMAVSTVRDTKTGKTYIKLVNAMPYSVKTNVNIPQAEQLLDTNATKEVKYQLLTGEPADKKARPTSHTRDTHIACPTHVIDKCTLER